MFASAEAAQEVLQDYFNEPGVELLLEVLVPAIVFDPIEAPAAPRPGATRIGGTPDFPAGQAWPLRPAFPNPEAVARLGGSAHGAHIISTPRAPCLPLAGPSTSRRRPTSARSPRTCRAGAVSSSYDGGVIPWRNGAETCRVIWDTTPVEKLVRADPPQALLDLDAEFQAEMAAIRRERGWPPPALTPHRPAGPRAAHRLRSLLRPPDQERHRRGRP